MSEVLKIDLPTKAKLVMLQEAMWELPQAELETNHYFAGGMYARELHQPKDCLVVGKIHKSEHFVIITKGSVTIACEDFKETFSAPAVIVSKPGAKRAIYANEDSVYMNVHKTDKTDLDEIEEELIEKEEKSLFDSRNKLKAIGAP